MKSSNVDSSQNNSQNKRDSWFKSYIAIIIAVISIIISGLSFYYTIFKTFDLKVDLNPEIKIQYRNNLGFYIFTSFFNNSPNNGSITKIAMVLYQSSSPDDKYLFTFEGFRETKEQGIYTSSDENLPIFFKPWSRETRVMNFIYTKTNEQFPIAMGTYISELYFWTDNSEKPSYRHQFSFDISADILDFYKEKRINNSTVLSPDIKIQGYAPLTSRKLTIQEYEELF